MNGINRYQRFFKAIRSTHFPSSQILPDLCRTLQQIPLEAAIYDHNGRYVFTNENYYRRGLSPDELIGQDDQFYFKQLKLDTGSLEKRRQALRSVLQDRKPVRFTEKLHFLEKDKTFYYKRTYQPVFDKNENEIRYVCSYGSNITAVILSQNELKYLAHHDKLTGLKNRDAFYDQLDQLINEAAREKGHSFTAILFCDLDNFKLVNDSLGHDWGDLALKRTAARLNNCLRRSDLVFRLSGDEFTIILKNIDNEFEAGHVAEKIIHELSQPFQIGSHAIDYLTVSIGIALFPQDGNDRETLVKKADTAMYHVKDRGKNRFHFFTEEMTQKSMERLRIINHLRSVVDHEQYDQQFTLVYQPIIEKQDGGGFKIIGSEALLRWQNPDLGSISPAVFIPLAEEANLIEPMSDWIILRAMTDLKTMLAGASGSFYTSVNLSARQLKSANLVGNMKRLLSRASVDPALVQIEITETSYLEEEGAAICNMLELERQGFRFAIDDFGVGFASLVYLQKIPAATIKIDRSFVQFAPNNGKNEQLLRSIIHLGQNLQKDIIAEGVESQTHLSFLESNQCYKYQGYLFSKPLPLAEFQSLLFRGPAALGVGRVE